MPRLNVLKRDQSATFLAVVNEYMDEGDMYLDELVIGVAYQVLVNDLQQERVPEYMTRMFGVLVNRNYVNEFESPQKSRQFAVQLNNSKIIQST